MNCPNCERALPQDDAIFCPWCAKQARCMNAPRCSALLAMDALACMRCGTLVGQGSMEDPALSEASSAADRLRNRISFTETPKSRNFEAELSDHAVDSLGDAFAAFAIGKLLPGGSARRPAGPNGTHTVDPRQLSLPGTAADGAIIEGVATHVSDLGVNLGGHGGIERLMAELDRNAHPEVKAAPRVLDHALHLLKIAKEEFALDGMTASELATALTDRFLIPTTHQAVRNAFARAGDKVHTTTGDDGVQRYRLMSEGEAYLANPETHRSATSQRKRQSNRTRARRGAKPNADDAVAADDSAGAKAREKRPKASAGKIHLTEAVSQLVSRGYFSSPRVGTEVLQELSQSLGHKYLAKDMAVVLPRLMRKGVLKREMLDGQNAYSNA